VPPISKILVFRILVGNPLISPLNCSNAAKSIITAATSMIVKTALNSMDRIVNSDAVLWALSRPCSSGAGAIPLRRALKYAIRPNRQK
jgi:hypothetical protein